MPRIGVLSDTHDYLDPRVLEIFAGVDHILHGGDVGLPWLILDLEQIAPVTCVLGNTDGGLHYRETESVTVAGRVFLVHHILNLHHPPAAVTRRIARQSPDAVIFGHTHKPLSETREGILYLNPGYAGKPRFGMDRSVAILHCEAEGLRVEFVDLG